MPLRRSPPTLSQAALCCIATNFELIAYNTADRDDWATLMHNEAFLQYPSVFSHLPSSTLADLVQAVGDLRSLSQLHLHQLMLPSLTQMNITPEVKHVHSALRLLVLRCQNIEYLNLSYLREISPHKMSQLFLNLPRLVSLDLQMSLCSDHTLDAIADSCPLLEELDLQRTSVSDVGLQLLGVGPAGPRCQALRVLRLNETFCSVEAVARAVIALPRLTELDYDNMIQVFELLSPRSRLEYNGPPLSLLSVKSTVEYVPIRGLNSMIALCPHIRQVVLSNGRLQNETLWKLGALTSLSHLYLTNSESLSLDFDEGVVPLLQMCGPKLKALILSNFTKVCLTTVDQLCPSLTKLAVSSVPFFEPARDPSSCQFSRLHALEIWSAGALSRQQLQLLLNSCHQLQNLLLQQCHALDDQLLQLIWQSNSMRHLSRLTLDNCSHVSADCISQLTAMDNQLTLVRLWSCSQLTDGLAQQLTARAARDNSPLHVEYYGCWQ